jgi:osmotically-inducible protein OsmY
MRLMRQQSPQTRRALPLVAAGSALFGWLGGFFFDKDQGRRRRRTLIDRTRGILRRRVRAGARVARGANAGMYGMAMKATHLHEQPKPQPDDVTLARKVETKIFRAADVPKGNINVNAQNGVVYLRGEADTPEMIEQLVEQTRKVKGVRNVENLLHLPKTRARMKE